MADTSSESPAATQSNVPQGLLRPSLLAAKADAMWNASKQQFQNSGKTISMGAIKLKTKTFSEVSSAQDKAKEERDKAAEDASKPKFIFGQNTTSRIILGGTTSKAEGGTEGGDIFKSAGNGITSTNHDELKKDAEEAAAKQKEELEKNIPTTSVIDIKTGEEGDQVIFQTGCKLHVFDKVQKRWMEKGLAVMKISKRFDEDGEHHRIIARTTGIHKLVINSLIFPDMVLERVDQKRLKISAMGADEPPTLTLFLVTFSFTNSDLSIEGAYNTLQSLIKKSKQDKSRKRKVSENDQVSEVGTKMERADIDSEREKRQLNTGGFEDGEQSSSSLSDSHEARESFHEADNEQQTSDSN